MRRAGSDQALINSLTELSETLTAIKHEQEYMEVRERTHRAGTDAAARSRWIQRGGRMAHASRLQ